jgi:hypothetical protein
MNKEQYALISARRQGTDGMVWQTPPLAVAAQAFLLAVVFDPGVAKLNAVITAGAAVAVGLASMHLMATHRLFEVQDAERLAAFERTHSDEGYAVVHSREAQRGTLKPGPMGWSTYKVWLCVLGGLTALSLFGGVAALCRP